jgi:DedD protein
MDDPADVNVDDLRRRARRRLVGAIVLALAAAVFVPMLLESDPRPLGEDVSVRIPPVDDGKFVNRLNDTSRAPSPQTDREAKEDRDRSEAGEAGRDCRAEPPDRGADGGGLAEGPPPRDCDDEAAAPGQSLAAPAAPPRCSCRPERAPAPSDPPLAGFSVQLAVFRSHGANALANQRSRQDIRVYFRRFTAKGM